MSSPTPSSLLHGEGTEEAVIAIGGMTCGSCARTVRTALERVTGVTSAEVDLDHGRARIRHVAGAVTRSELHEAVRQAGYEPVDQGQTPPAISSLSDAACPKTQLFWPITAGTLGAALLTALYVVVVTVAQNWAHALELVTTDWYFVGAITAGFGVQVGLFVHMRLRLKARTSRSSTALTGAGTGTSTVAMLACCAHHAGDLLPLIGLSGAAVFLTDYRVPFMVLGVATNIVGILFMLRQLRKHRALACAA